MDLRGLLLRQQEGDGRGEGRKLEGKGEEKRERKEEKGRGRNGKGGAPSSVGNGAPEWLIPPLTEYAYLIKHNAKETICGGFGFQY